MSYPRYAQTFADPFDFEKTALTALKKEVLPVLMQMLMNREKLLARR
jgi:hypothetical protein